MSFIVDKETGKRRFDLRVEIVDPKSGKLEKYQPYQKFVQRGADPEEWYVRAGKRYAMDGTPLDKKKIAEELKAAADNDLEKDLL